MVSAQDTTKLLSVNSADNMASLNTWDEVYKNQLFPMIQFVPTLYRYKSVSTTPRILVSRPSGQAGLDPDWFGSDSSNRFLLILSSLIIKETP